MEKVRVTEICINKIVLFAFILEFERAETCSYCQLVSLELGYVRR